jgi:heme-degrading monooxygenase HmoA
MNRSITHVLSMFSLLVLGCTSSMVEPEGMFDPDVCRATVVQPDLLSQSPDGPEAPGVAPYWFGPGVDPSTGQPTVPDGAIVTTTYLQLRPEASAQQRFGELSGPVVGTLVSARGVIAISLVTSESCAVARTLVVWEDEESMVEFVASDAHIAAISAVSEVSRGGSITMNWLASASSDATWEAAASRLASHAGPIY